MVDKEGSFFGFPFCHTGPAGGNVDVRPYLRPVGVGPQLVDPDLNANESVMKCNGPAASLQFVPAIQAMGPHTAPLGMVSGRGKGKGGSVGVAAWRAACGRICCIAHMHCSVVAQPLLQQLHLLALPNALRQSSTLPSCSASTAGLPAPTSRSPLPTPSSSPSMAGDHL